MKRFTVTVLACVAAIFLAGFVVYFQTSAQHHKNGVGLISDAGGSPLASATVSFGGWLTGPHLCPPFNSPVPCPVVDRFANNAQTQFPRFSNHHALTPRIATIKAGGTVNFVIGGLHVVTVYDDGTQPEDIDTTILVPNRPGPPIIDDSENRIYRGLDPFLLPPTASQDRVEVVQFDEPGTYLVICSVRPHFQDGMYGYVRVLPGGKN